MTSTTFTHRAARDHYNAFGERQDRQSWYEQPAFDQLIAEGRFQDARAIWEFGVGTGALLAQLLQGPLSDDAEVYGTDISDVMIGLAQHRLAKWAPRVRLAQTDGSPGIPYKESTIDRVVSTYVLDLLGEEDIVEFLAEARRVLHQDGLLCLAGTTPGSKGISRIISMIWRKVHAIRPALLGGCRPLQLNDHLVNNGWRIQRRTEVQSFGVASEIIIAKPL